MSGRIVVGVDGSQGARAALEWALAEARLRGDTVEVVHAWHAPPHMIPGPYAGPAAAGEEATDRMREQAERLLEHQGPSRGHTRRRDRIDRADGLRGELAPRRREGRRPARRRHPRPRRLHRPPARFGQPAGLAPRALPGRRRPSQGRAPRAAARPRPRAGRRGLRAGPPPRGGPPPPPPRTRGGGRSAISCSIATVVAMALPYALARSGRDPAYGSGPLATVIRDLLSVIVYFAIATALI